MTWTKQTTSSGGTSSSTSKWQGKKWNVLGDSLTEVNSKTNMHYHDYIKSDWGMTVNNYGISGTGWYTPSWGGGHTDYFWNRVSGMDATADLITVFGGTNDWGDAGQPLVLGSLGDTSGSTSFYGAVDATLSQLITKYPTKTIAVFTPIPRQSAFPNVTSANGYTMQNVADAIIAVCSKYSIPCLDLFRKSNLAPWNTTANNTYFTAPSASSPDGLHPNDAGHKILADKILSFLNTL